MRYLIRTPEGKVSPCDEETALIKIEETPSSFIARFGTDHWIRGKTFLDYGDIAFERSDFRILVSPINNSDTDLLVTTETFPPYTIAARLGLVASERVMTINALKELSIGISDIFGGSSGTLQKELEAARREVLSDLKKQAASLGAQGVIAVHLNFSPIGSKDTMMLLASAYGTAVNFSGETAD